jgi:hypothetical protein
MIRPRKTARERMSEWVLHCAINQRHIRRSQPTREAALKDPCAQLLQGHAVNRIVGPSETLSGGVLVQVPAAETCRKPGSGFLR